MLSSSPARERWKAKAAERDGRIVLGLPEKRTGLSFISVTDHLSNLHILTSTL